MSDLKDYRTIRFDGVLVAGGGVAGCAAAIGAARAGAPVRVLEEGISPGGMATSGLLPLWMSGTDSPLQREFTGRSASCGVGHSGCRPGEIDHEALKLALEQWFEELGIEVRYNVRVIDAAMEGDRIVGVYAAAPEGLLRIDAPVVIDATGDGAAAAAAGVPYTLGRESDHRCQGASLAFEVGNVKGDVTKLPDSFDVPFPTPRGDAAELARKHLAPPAGHLILHATPEPGVVSANMTNAIGFDFTAAEGRSEAIRLCRRQIAEIVGFLREYMPGFEECRLLRSASEFGIRESRHFRGRHVLTEREILEGKVFDDWIATRNYFPFDLHSVEGSGLDRNGAIASFSGRRSYTVPLASCLPEACSGLLLAGRNISGTHVAHSSFRVMPICLNIGLGAGVAAAIALRERVLPEAVDLRSVQRELLRQGVLPPEGEV